MMNRRRLTARAPRRPAAGRARTRAAFTLLELAVVVALGATLFLVLGRWALSLSATAGASTDLAAARRDASYADTLLGTDTQDARGCDPSGQDAPLRDLQPDSVQLYVTHTDADGAPDPTAPVDLVLWRLSGSQLQRAVLAGDGSCSFDPTTASWTTIADAVSAADGTNAFTGTGNRDAAPGTAAYYGSCTGMNAENCLDSALTVRLIFHSPGADGGTVPLRTDYDLLTSGGGL